MNQNDVPQIPPFEFKPGLVGRLRKAWHSISGKWVETHQNEQQTRINRTLFRQRIDLDEWLIEKDRETIQLKSMINVLSKELRETRKQLASLEQRVNEATIDNES